MSYAASWCFTLNNYTDGDVARLPCVGERADVLYLVAGKEVGDSGTPHLQGFVKFMKRVRLPQVKTIFGWPTMHVEVARDQGAAAEYCKKDGDFQEFGSLLLPRRRSDLDDFKATVCAGNLNLASLRELHSEVFAKHPRFCIDYVSDHAPTRPLPYYPLYGWQADLYGKLVLPPDERKIIFVVDKKGNTGKSWFSRYYCHLHENAMVLTPGKKIDMAYVLRTDIKVLFMDAPRSKQGEYIQYDFLEECKNGYVASYKYESRMKTLDSIHLVVMMNEHPDYSKLSMDRYDVIELN